MAWFDWLFATSSQQGIKDELVAWDPTKELRPRQSAWGNVATSDLPLFNLWWAELMLRDPVVQIGLLVRDAAISAGEVECRGRDANEVAFVRRQWEAIWGQHGHKLLRAKEAGYAAFQAVFRLDESTGHVEIEGIKDFRPMDCRPLTVENKVCGFRVRGAGVGMGSIDVMGPRSLWVTYNTRFGWHYGRSILRDAYDPWWEKHMDRGARKTRQLRMIKDAWSGLVYHYPLGESFKTPDGSQVSWRDVMREEAENVLAGGAVGCPSNLRDASGNSKLDFTRLPEAGDPKAVFEWVDKLDIDILRGLGVAEEVIQAAAHGGTGFSGRSIPMIVTLQGCQREFAEVVACIDRDILRPLCWLNFGRKPSYTLSAVDLAETFAKLMGGSPMGGESMGGQASSGVAAGGQARPPVRPEAPPVQGPRQSQFDEPSER